MKKIECDEEYRQYLRKIAIPAVCLLKSKNKAGLETPEGTGFLVGYVTIDGEKRSVVATARHVLHNLTSKITTEVDTMFLEKLQNSLKAKNSNEYTSWEADFRKLLKTPNPSYIPSLKFLNKTVKCSMAITFDRSNENGGCDLGFIITDELVDITPLQLYNTPETLDPVVVVVGFPKLKSSDLYGSNKNAFFPEPEKGANPRISIGELLPIEVPDRIISHDCVTLVGSSGSPLIGRKKGQGPPRVLGVHVHYETNSTVDHNGAVPAWDLNDRLKLLQQYCGFAKNST